jgi:hypothetical protein
MSETTNALLEEIDEKLERLIAWADADAENSPDAGAKAQARDDRWRSNQLFKARNILRDCRR